MKYTNRWSSFRILTLTGVAVLILGNLLISSGAVLNTASLRIVNNSTRTIRNIYLSHADADDWGSDQLGEASLGAGESFTISNLNWDQSQVKVIAEDQDGCFLSGVVNVTDNAAWTITSDTPADCGGGN